jgi:hypothetical protein
MCSPLASGVERPPRSYAARPYGIRQLFAGQFSGMNLLLQGVRGTRIA